MFGIVTFSSGGSSAWSDFCIMESSRKLMLLAFELKLGLEVLLLEVGSVGFQRL